MKRKKNSRRVSKETEYQKRKTKKSKTKNKNAVTYHNKDVMSKILAENFKDKSLKVYGIDVPEIRQVLPTNLPAIQVNEMRIDNLFLLKDGSIAVIDYESSVKWENNLKYLNYIGNCSVPSQLRPQAHENCLRQ